jgi:hypothetical protein
MSSPTFVQPARTAPTVPAYKILAATIGAVIALVGALVAISGGALLAVFGADGAATSGSHALTTSGAAFVSETATIEDTAGVTDVVGAPRIKISADSRGGGDVFVGVARAADVDRYLAGAPVAEVTDINLVPYRMTRHARTGSATPAAPTSQDFWVAKSSGASAKLDWKVRDGDYRFVVMNADGSRGVSSEATVGVAIPHVPAIGWTGVILGMLIAAGGLATTVVAARRTKS